MPPAPVISPVPRETAGEKTGGDQIALLKNKPIESLPERKPLVRPVPRVLEGFVVQLAFNDKEKARSWAEAMEKRGYAVSVTEAEAEGALRVRLGNFAQRDEAERQLRNFKQEGLNGIIINLPQGFRPVARSSIP
jgi:cell division septation protein DedD